MHREVHSLTYGGGRSRLIVVIIPFKIIQYNTVRMMNALECSYQKMDSRGHVCDSYNGDAMNENRASQNDKKHMWRIKSHICSGAHAQGSTRLHGSRQWVAGGE